MKPQSIVSIFVRCFDVKIKSKCVEWQQDQTKTDRSIVETIFHFIFELNQDVQKKTKLLE